MSFIVKNEELHKLTVKLTKSSVIKRGDISGKESVDKEAADYISTVQEGFKLADNA